MTKPSAFHQAQRAIWKAQIEARKREIEQSWADFLRCPVIDERGQFIGWCGSLISGSAKLREAGYTRRDTRLTCDECGKSFSAQMLPIHKCQGEG